uniref:Uncharacterized protein n=1 Tax=Solanum lycopersicum TaxID=4081 RepID=A0A3Q7ETU3_SOLLC
MHTFSVKWQFLIWIEPPQCPRSTSVDQDLSLKVPEKVKQDEFFPADLIFLASTNPDGVCYIETANLDGETNLKIRKALERTWDYVSPEKISTFRDLSMKCTVKPLCTDYP